MTGRVTRWAVGGLGVGLLPLLLAYLITSYVTERPPTLDDLLGTGDVLLVVPGWSIAAFFDLQDVRSARVRRLRDALARLSLFLISFSAVAYGCLTTVSVTGHVQTQGQREMVATATLWLLATAMTSSGVAAYLAARHAKEDT